MADVSFDSVRSSLPSAIQGAIEATIRYIGKDPEGHIKLPLRERVRLVVDQNTDLHRPGLEFYEEPSLTGFFERQWQSIDHLPEVVHLDLLLAMIQYVDIPPKALTYEFREKHAKEESTKIGWDITRPVLEVCLYRHFHGETKEEYLPWIIDRIEAGARMGYFAERHTGPVIKLQIDGTSEIPLDENIRLRRLTPKERARLCDPDDVVPSRLSDFEALETHWVFEMDVYHVTEKEPEYYPANPSDVFDWYLTALRLVKPGSFYVPHVTVQDLPGESAEFGHIDPMFPRNHIRGGTARIREAELPNLLEWFSKIVPVLARSKRERLDIAIGRFNESFLRQRNIDVIIDSAIGLEALLLGDQSNSTTHVLMLRASVLLGRTLKESQAVIDRFKLFFKVRNSSVPVFGLCNQSDI